MVGEPRPQILPIIDRRNTPAVQSAEMTRLMAIQARHESEILKIPGVVGIGIGVMEAIDRLEFKIFVVELTPTIQQAIPSNLEGVPVKIVVSGEIVAQ
jgi:hypothetical protein